MSIAAIKQSAKAIVEASYKEKENQLYIKELAKKIEDLTKKELENV